MNPNFVDRQITFSRTPDCNEAARQELVEHTKEYRASGGQIQHIPFGMSAVNRDDFHHLYHPHEVVT